MPDPTPTPQPKAATPATGKPAGGPPSDPRLKQAAPTRALAVGAGTVGAGVVAAGGAPGAETGEEVQEEQQDEVGRALVAMAPWAISTLIHAAMVLMAIWAVWIQVQKPLEEEIIIPSTVLTDTPGSPIVMRQTKEKLQTTTSSARRTVTQTETSTKSTLSSKVKLETRVLGAVGGASGKSSPFGTGVVGSGGPFQSSLYGNGGNAKRIAYLIDASGSLIDTLPFVIMELKRSISGLSDKQSFCVIFFQGEDAIEARGATQTSGLLPATPANKQAVMKWIDPASGNIVPHGESNPLPAFKKALGYRPQLLYILSDNITGEGRWEMDQKTVLQEIRSANISQTKINTIQFLHDDPLVKYGMGRTLEKISEQSGGIFKFVDARSLGLE
jgi:hypothetical protein